MSKKVLIIAEAGVNHNGSLETAKRLIDEAASAGADIVKFQTFVAAKLVSKQAPKAQYQLANAGKEDESQLDMLKKLELNEEAHKVLIEHCRLRNIQFLSTPFDEDSLDLLIRLGINTFKIPSGEITNYPHLKRIGSLNAQVILSSGMSTLQEISEALNLLMLSGTDKKNISVLHCTTEYPAPMNEINLLAMQTIGQKLGVKTGYSDHTMGIEVPLAAVALGAEIIEKHFTLDKNMEGPDHKASLEPTELADMVRGIRNIEKALGSNEKIVSPSEKKNLAVARKSMHFSRDLKKGHKISEEDIVMKRPGNGISPMKFLEVIGKTLTADVKAEEQLTPAHLE